MFSDRFGGELGMDLGEAYKHKNIKVRVIDALTVIIMVAQKRTSKALW